MKGDFTKFSSRYKQRFTRVLKQQGRVDLDSDWNEYNDIGNYAARTTRIDTLGVYGVPVGGGGFGTTWSGGDLHFSPGRLYIKGIQCELFEDTPYLSQPFWANPTPLGQTVGQTDAVFLDVWERHISWVEDPSILEPGLGGPDTTTRVQTVFQIRVNPNVGSGTTCGAATLPQPSGGLMTPTVVPAPPSDDPCLIAPSGGYTGLENRLYRVEIHDPSSAKNGATFKWSRDNGSIVFPVTEFVAGQPTQIKVQRLGRDQVLAIRLGDWVEVLGDATEFAVSADPLAQSGASGTLAQVMDIDQANLLLTLSKDVSAYATAGHPKVRRWDQPSDVIPIAAGPISLEDGVQVSFTGINYLCQDYWTFSARTATGNIEPQPTPPDVPDGGPAGIIHYYVPLALVTWQSAGTDPQIQDCRPTRQDGGSGCCCCSVTVGDGVKSKGDFSTIQAALDSLTTQDFAEVCLLPGTYTLDKFVAITRGNRTIRGCGSAATVNGPGNGPAFRVYSGDALSTIEDVSFESLNINLPGEDPAILAINSGNINVTDSEFFSEIAAWAITAQSNGLVIKRNVFSGCAIFVADGSSLVRIRDNQIFNSNDSGIKVGGLPPKMDINSKASGVIDIEITGNEIAGSQRNGIIASISLDDRESGDIEGLLIANNDIADCAQDPKPAQNGESLAGIMVGGAEVVRIHENIIRRNGSDANTPTCGILAALIENLEISNNQILNNGISNDNPDAVNTAFQGGLILLYIFGAPALRVHDNVVETPSGQSLLIVGAGPMSICGNSFISGGVYLQPEGAFSAGIYINNLSDQGASLGALENSKAYHPAGNDSASTTTLGQLILFNDNQVLFQPESTPVYLTIANAIITAWDVGINGNQFAYLSNSAPLGIHLTSMAFSLRTLGNAFAETAAGILVSYIGIGTMVNVSNNQSTNCIFVSGAAPDFPAIEVNNQQLVNPFPNTACDNLVNTLNSLLP